MPYREPMSSQCLAAHKRRLRKCVGSVCVTEALSATGLTSVRRLEAVLRGGTPPIDATGKPMWSGLCKHWRNGTALPSDAMCKRAHEATAGRARLTYWRDHALWSLLVEPNHLDARHIVDMLWQLPAPVRHVLFLNLSRSRPILAEISDERLRDLRRSRSLDALVALLGLARIADQMCHDERHAVLTSSAFSILAPVVHESPQLQPLSEPIFQLVCTSFWSHWYLGGVRQDLTYETFRRHLDALASNPNAECDSSIGYLRVEGYEDERDVFALGAVIGWDMR